MFGRGVAPRAKRGSSLPEAWSKRVTTSGWRRWHWAAYAFCSILAAVSGLALTAQIGSGQAVISAQLTLESIAAAVIAGVSLKGGVGRVEMVTLAAFFLLILTDAMDLLKIDPRIQTIFLGSIVVLAVAVDEMAKRRASVD